MTRLEEALIKLQARRTAVAGAAADVAPRATQVTQAERPAAHVYGGKPFQVDLGKLRRLALVAAQQEERKLAEQYRMIKRPLLRNAGLSQAPQVLRGNVLLVTSALPGEGKTFTSLNLCFSLAREQDWSVVLVDGDSNKPHLSRLFGAEKEPGLMDLLRDPTKDLDALVKPSDVPNFGFLPAGGRHSESAELLASSAMRSLCERAGNSDPKRLIVFDSPPLLLTAEAQALAAQMGQIVVVVKANHTPQRAVVSALSRLDPTKAISLLLNQASKGTDDDGYGDYYYGSGSGD